MKEEDAVAQAKELGYDDTSISSLQGLLLMMRRDAKAPVTLDGLVNLMTGLNPALDATQAELEQALKDRKHERKERENELKLWEAERASLKEAAPAEETVQKLAQQTIRLKDYKELYEQEVRLTRHLSGVFARFEALTRQQGKALCTDVGNIRAKKPLELDLTNPKVGLGVASTLEEPVTTEDLFLPNLEQHVPLYVKGDTEQLARIKAATHVRYTKLETRLEGLGNTLMYLSKGSLSVKLCKKAGMVYLTSWDKYLLILRSDHTGKLWEGRTHADARHSLTIQELVDSSIPRTVGFHPKRSIARDHLLKDFFKYNPTQTAMGWFVTENDTLRTVKEGETLSRKQYALIPGDEPIAADIKQLTFEKGVRSKDVMNRTLGELIAEYDAVQGATGDVV